MKADKVGLVGITYLDLCVLCACVCAWYEDMLNWFVGQIMRSKAKGDLISDWPQTIPIIERQQDLMKGSFNGSQTKQSHHAMASHRKRHRKRGQLFTIRIQARQSHPAMVRHRREHQQDALALSRSRPSRVGTKPGSGYTANTSQSMFCMPWIVQVLTRSGYLLHWLLRSGCLHCPDQNGWVSRWVFTTTTALLQNMLIFYCLWREARKGARFHLFLHHMYSEHIVMKKKNKMHMFTMCLIVYLTSLVWMIVYHTWLVYLTSLVWINWILTDIDQHDLYRWPLVCQPHVAKDTL